MRIAINLTNNQSFKCSTLMNQHRLVLILIFLGLMPLVSFTENATKAASKKKFKVVLDAGHGGHDPGNIGNGYLEKNIALTVVKLVGRILSKSSDIEVVYTRDDDTFVDLLKRGEIANKAKADLFVSVHCNAHNSDAYGAETYVLSLSGNNKNIEVAKKENSVIYLEDDYEKKYSDYNINSPSFVIGSAILQEEFLDQSIALAKLVQDNFVQELSRKDRKVKQAAFIVLHQTFMPSVLIELGFLTNKNEGYYLNSSNGQSEMATAIANAILSYKDGVDANLIEVVNTRIQNNSLDETQEAVVENNQANQPVQNDTSKDKTLEVKNSNIPAQSQNPDNNAVLFKVQLLASSQIIPLKPQNFGGLSSLSSEPYKNLFRYMTGSTHSYKEAQRIKREAGNHGYTSAYIVAYKNGQRITIQEALN